MEPTASVKPATNTVTTSRQQIAAQIDQFAKSINSNGHYSKIEYDVTLPDPRLKLAFCQAPLTIENRSPNRTIGRLTLRVACSAAQKPWAVNISMNLKAFDQVIMTSRPIPKGSKITADMLTRKQSDVTSLRQGYFKEMHHVVGAITKYAVSGNRVLKPGNILPPTLVAKGERVVIKATAAGLSIRTTGIALSNGALGELVRVKNSQTTRIIEGRVSAAGQVTVSL